MKKKIYINPGHSDKDPGAVGFETERQLNVKTAKYMDAYLKENYECLTKTTPGSNNSPLETAREANQWGADLFVSIHNNAGGGDGYEALVYSEAQVPLGKLFEQYVKAAGQNSRGVKLRPGLTVLNMTKMPTVLNESAFVDNEKDIADWNEDEELKKLGIAYAEATAEAAGLDKKVVAPAPAPVDSNVVYRVQVGAYGNKANAEAMQKKLAAAGFDGIIVKGTK